MKSDLSEMRVYAVRNVTTGEYLTRSKGGRFWSARRCAQMKINHQHVAQGVYETEVYRVEREEDT